MVWFWEPDHDGEDQLGLLNRVFSCCELISDVHSSAYILLQRLTETLPEQYLLSP